MPFIACTNDVHIHDFVQICFISTQLNAEWVRWAQATVQRHRTDYFSLSQCVKHSYSCSLPLSLSLSLLLLFGSIASVYVAKTFPYKTQRQTLSLPSVTYVSSMNFTWFQFVGWFSAYFLSITSEIVRFRPYFVSFWNLNLRRCCVSDFILIHLILYPNHNVYSTDGTTNDSVELIQFAPKHRPNNV